MKINWGRREENFTILIKHISFDTIFSQQNMQNVSFKKPPAFAGVLLYLHLKPNNIRKVIQLYLVSPFEKFGIFSNTYFVYINHSSSSAVNVPFTLK